MGQKIAIIFTGGTISMSKDPETGKAVPELKSNDIIATLNKTVRDLDFELIDFAHKPSPSFTNFDMLNLSRIIDEIALKPEIKGFVVTHGTDTMDESGYFVNLTVKTDKPIVFTGAMRDSSQLSYDGPHNLYEAILVANCDDSANYGVLHVMNGEINLVSEITKTHTSSLDTFKSLEYGPIGRIDDGVVRLLRMPIKKTLKFDVSSVDYFVEIVNAHSSSGSRVIDILVDNKVDGIVIEGLGIGNVPDTMVPGIVYAISRGIPVILTSKCVKGSVIPTYGYIGGGAHLEELGVILGGNLNAQRARLKLLAALGSNTANISEIF